jgi:hypothetical protein
MPVEDYKHEHALDTDSIPPSDTDPTDAGSKTSGK